MHNTVESLTSAYEFTKCSKWSIPASIRDDSIISVKLSSVECEKTAQRNLELALKEFFLLLCHLDKIGFRRGVSFTTVHRITTLQAPGSPASLRDSRIMSARASPCTSSFGGGSFLGLLDQRINEAAA